MSGDKLKSLQLSVGNLVEFSGRRGDLFADIPFGPSSREGIAGHQKIQKSRGKDWQAEFRLKASLELEGYKVTLQGRVDLVNENQSPTVIEELKTTYTSPENIPQEKSALHWAQAKVYGYLYYLHKRATDISIDLSTEINIVMSWYDLTTDELTSETQSLKVATLQNFTQSLLEDYLKWHQQFSAHRNSLINSAKALEFPFKSYRIGQYDFARRVYQTIKDKQQLLVEAPTGTGKTMSTLFPVCKAIGETLIEQVVYLTAKGSAQTAAKNAIETLQDNSLNIDYLVIQAKDKACPCRSKQDSIKHACDDGNGKCNRTIGFFDRLPKARFECLETKSLDTIRLQTIAAKHQLCPFELSLQMIRWSSVVICDFNYVLDPMVRLAVFDESRNKRVILIDEIHNLPDRARDMYSATLSAFETKTIAKQLSKAPTLKKRVQSLAQAINRQSDETVQIEGLPKPVTNAINKFLETLGASDINSGFGSDMTANQPEGFNEWLKQVYRYVFISELYDQSHVTLANDNSNNAKYKSINLRLKCLDAANFLAKKYRSARSIIGFSATLSPLDFYLRMLGFKHEALAISLPAVFPPANQLTLRCDYIDTRWLNRDSSIEPLCTLIQSTFEARPGKYLVFFPSYQYMDKCYQYFIENYSISETVIQNRGSNDLERQAFLQSFFSSDVNTIGFAILGGVFGEGVDFAGDSLTGAIVIGTGMPQPDKEQKLIESYFVEQGLNGFQFAYQFPGFTRVKQTAGRVIRSELDRGVVVLIDPRFKRQDYSALMPAHWEIRACSTPEAFKEHLSTFWTDDE